MSRLDVLIPHFRDPDGLARSLDSVVAQDWTGDIRVVVVDDGSPEPEFRAARAQLDALELPVTLERNAENRGRPYTRNRLLDLVDGDFVAWLDADDVWYPDKLTRQFEHLSRLRFAGADVSRVWITCHYDWQWSGARARRIDQETEGRQLRELMLGQRLRAYLWTLLGPAASFRAVGRFDERLPRLQDLDYFLRFVAGGGALEVPPVRRALCRYHKSDLGRDAAEIRRCNRLIHDKYRPALQAYGPAFLKTIRYNAERLSARYAANNGARLMSGWYLGRSVVAHPKRAVGAARFWLAREEA
jgi:glycosyltransferase involved in cell wall biosynthesis